MICDNRTRFRLRDAMWVGVEMLFEYQPVVFLHTLGASAKMQMKMYAYGVERWRTPA